MLKLKNIFTVLALFIAGAVFAQGQAHKIVVDKIIGVVGDRIILQSDVMHWLMLRGRASNCLQMPVV